MKYYEIRDPILGFIAVNEWEREIIDHWAFQRLRRIKQLAWTDMVYPGATHSRFEHSLGVMHIATQMFDSIVNKNAEFLKSELNFTEAGFQRDRVLVRLAGLLHDIGHPPFSHAGEELMPETFGDMCVRDLELRSTIIFVDRDAVAGSREIGREDFVQEIKSIKPHFSCEEIDRAVEELEALGFIEKRN